MNFKVFFFISAFCFISLNLFSQKTLDIITEENISNEFEQAAEQSTQDVDLSQLSDELQWLKEHPIDLNTATKEDLQKLNLLSDIENNNILNYIKKNGKMLSIYELQSVDGFYEDLIKKILPFVYVSKNIFQPKLTLKNIFNYGYNDLLLRSSRTLQKQAGYSTQDSSGKFLGSPEKYTLKYRFYYQNNISCGLTAVKHSGEEFFKGTQKNGFDFYSFHFYYHQKGFIKTVAIGDYQVQFGQGLTIWKGFSISKTTDIMNVKKNGLGIKPYHSDNEFNFMRGAATTLSFSHIEVTPFFSCKKVDATLNQSSETGDNPVSFSSLIESPIHATINDMIKKHNLTETIYGIHASSVFKKLTIGTGIYRLTYSLPQIQQNVLYNKFEFQGSCNSNAGVDYSLLLKKISLFGEVSKTLKAGSAMLQGFSAQLTRDISFSMLYRNYAKDFHPLLSKSFSENTTSENEKGLFIGILFKLLSVINVYAYCDYYTFPWLKYQTNAPSCGNDYMFRFEYIPSDEMKMIFQFSQKNKQINIASASDAINYLENSSHQNLKYSLYYQVSSSFFMQSRIECVKNKTENNSEKQGWLIFQDIIYKNSDHPFSVVFRYAVFGCDTYDERIYAYENDVAYDYSMATYYYSGSRTSIMLKFKINKYSDCQIKFNHTFYSNKNEIGTGANKINGNKVSDIKLQLRIML